MNQTKIIANSSIVLLIAGSVYADEKPPSTAAAAAKAPPPPAVAKSAGLLNDWLRSESDFFNPWDLGGQFRVRYEVKDGGGVSPATDFRAKGVDNENDYFLMRAKAHLGFNSTWFGAYAEGRDAHAISDEREPSPDTDSFDLYQAYVTLGNAKEFPLTAKIGRQDLVYGDERLVGNGDWGNLGRSFDAAKLRFENSSFWVDAFVSRIVLPDHHNFNVVNDYDFLSGLYASTKSLVPKTETQLYLLARNTSTKSAEPVIGSILPTPSARDIYTLGTRWKSLPGQLGGWDYGLELAGQLGSIKRGGPTTDRLDQQAWAASVGLGYTWTNVCFQPRLGFEYNVASGDSDATDDKSETFEQLFPTNHKHYGYMDFVGWKNVHNPRFMASIKPHKKVQVTLDYHLFWLYDTQDSFYAEAGARRGGTGATGGAGYGINPKFDSFLGSEINLDVTYSPTPYAIVRGGYGHFFTGNYVDNSLKGVGGSTGADWLYLQLTLNF